MWMLRNNTTIRRRERGEQKEGEVQDFGEEQ